MVLFQFFTIIRETRRNSEQWGALGGVGGCTCWVTQRSPRQSPGCAKPTCDEHWTNRRWVTREGGATFAIISKPKQAIVFDLVEAGTGREATLKFPRQAAERGELQSGFGCDPYRLR